MSKAEDKEKIYVRDPIHGSVWVNPKELLLIDLPFLQRLRHIKQLGFADFAFSGATHTRYGHSLGAMHVATRLFDCLFAAVDLPQKTKARFRQTVRLAMLFHDIGHAPLSHTLEVLMPKVDELGLGTRVNRQATHEDYTLKMVLDSALSRSIDELFGSEGVTPTQVAALISGERVEQDFIHGGLNYGPVLRQIVTSECDADRMDYLPRDSFYCGVNYGKFDAEWLINNVVPIEKDNAVYFGIRSRAIFSFEDFLLSRYHMFASVYLHHTPVILEKMFQQYVLEEEKKWVLPSDIEDYLLLDDIELWHRLRRSSNPWAKRVVQRRPFYLLDEGGTNPSVLCERLTEKKVSFITTHSKSILSKYSGQKALPLFVLTGSGETIPLETYTPLYERYRSPAEFHRVYVAPEDKEKAQQVFKQMVNRNGER